MCEIRSDIYGASDHCPVVVEITPAAASCPRKPVHKLGCYNSISRPVDCINAAEVAPSHLAVVAEGALIFGYCATPPSRCKLQEHFHFGKTSETS